MAYTEKSVPQVILNKMTRAQYNAATKNPDELYAITDESLDDYVKKTDYATTTKAGIICAGNWVTVNPTTHKLEAGELTKAQFDNAAGNTFISKTTLNNVLATIPSGDTENFPNVTIIGAPTINEGQASNFNEYRYLQFPFVFDLTGKTFQIDFCFTTGNDVTTQQNIIDSKFGLALAIQNGHGVMSISSNGQFWDIGTSTGQINITANTTYYARLSWNGSVYRTALSTNGTSYSNDMSLNSSERPFPTTHYIGGANSQVLGRYNWPFLGTINLNKCSMTINGTLIWRGMDNLGLATRADISLSNIDPAGEQRIRDLAGGADFAPVTPTVIGKYGGKDLYRIAISIESRTFAASDVLSTGEAGQSVGFIMTFPENAKVVRTYGSISKSSLYTYPREPRGGIALPYVEFTEGNSARIWVKAGANDYEPASVVVTVTGSTLYGWSGDYAVVEYTLE